jgi:hypothetical protein
VHERHPHVVGSIPLFSAEEAMKWQLDRLPGLRYISGDETGERSRWVVSFVESLRNHPDLEVRLTRLWPAGRPLEYIHAPLAGGRDPVPVDPEFYRRSS